MKKVTNIIKYKELLDYLNNFCYRNHSIYEIKGESKFDFKEHHNYDEEAESFQLVCPSYYKLEDFKEHFKYIDIDKIIKDHDHLESYCIIESYGIV